jgi:hypothetical protein
MLTRLRALCLATAALACSAPLPGAAAMVTYFFEGEVTFFDDVPPAGQLEARYPVGTRIRGSYRFSDALQDDVNPIAEADPNFGVYFPASYEVLIDDLIFGTSSFSGAASLRVFNDTSTARPGTVDFYNINDFDSSGPGSGVQPVAVHVFNVSLSDSDATVFADDSLPAVLPPLAAFEEASFRIEFGSGDSLNGTITALVVPEPRTYALLLAGLGLLGFAAGRRRA